MTTESVALPRRLFSFPDPVNEVAVRITATGVATMALATLLTGRGEILMVLCYGFVARAAAGPRLSPLAWFSSRVLAPRLVASPRHVPGPPKRFAQAMGAGMSGIAVACFYGFGWHAAAFVLTAVIATLATVEAGFAICVGCIVHQWLVRRGVIRSVDCEDCADVSGRLRRPQVSSNA